MNDPMDILTLPEIADTLRCGQKKARQLLADGKIPGRLDYRWTAYRRDVMAYHERNTAEPRTNRRRGRGRRAA
jgi:hypothetical protein